MYNQLCMIYRKLTTKIWTSNVLYNFWLIFILLEKKHSIYFFWSQQYFQTRLGSLAVRKGWDANCLAQGYANFKGSKPLQFLWSPRSFCYFISFLKFILIFWSMCAHSTIQNWWWVRRCFACGIFYNKTYPGVSSLQKSSKWWSSFHDE